MKRGWKNEAIAAIKRKKLFWGIFDRSRKDCNGNYFPFMAFAYSRSLQYHQDWGGTLRQQGASRTFQNGLLVIAASTVYLIYSIYIYFFGSAASYHMYIAIGIAAVTTYELIISIYGIKKAKRTKDIKQETLKYINLASALISVSLTQTAILSFTTEGRDMSHAYAVGDAVFGMLALFVGVLMMIRANQLGKSM